jgi:hypothetical protein
MIQHTYKGTTYSIPYRDNRRKKCYDGEREAFGKSFLEQIDGGNLKSSCEFARKVVNSKTWLRLREQHGKLSSDGACWIQQGGLAISDGRGTTFARGGSGWINLPRWARTKPVILHELAHNLVGSGIGHHWPFNRAYIDLVAVFIGKAEAKRLEKCLKAAGAKTRPPKQLSPETLEKMRERGRQLAAARRKNA